MDNTVISPSSIPAPSPSNLKTVIVQDPTSDANLQPIATIFKGSLDNTFQPYPSLNYSNSSIQFNIVVPSPDIIVDRSFLYLGLPVEIDITGSVSNTSPILNYGVTDAFKAFPVEQMFSNIQVFINNLSIAFPCNDLLPWLYRYSEFMTDEEESMEPQYQDRSQYYEELVGSLENPLSGNQNAGLPYIKKRGTHPVWIITNTNTNATIQTFFYARIPMPPFNHKYRREPGFSGVQNLVFNFTIDPNWANRIFAHANTLSSIANISATITNLQSGGVNSVSYLPQQPTLYLRYHTPSIPHSVLDPHYNPYTLFDRFPNDQGSAWQPNQLYTVTSSNIQLNAIPRRIYLYARLRNSSITYNTPDVFATIVSVNITFNNRAGLLSSASIMDLYNIALKNGYQGRFTDWIGSTGAKLNGANAYFNNYHSTFGSILAIDFGDDIGLSPAESPGLNGTWQLVVKVTFQANVQGTYSFYIVSVTPGVFFTQNLQAYAAQGNLSVADILNAPSTTPIEPIVHRDYTGSGFGDIVGKISRGISNFMSNPLLSKVTSALGSPAESIRQGIQGISSGIADFTGHGRKRKRRGGKLMSIRDLIERAREEE